MNGQRELSFTGNSLLKGFDNELLYEITLDWVYLMPESEKYPGNSRSIPGQIRLLR